MLPDVHSPLPALHGNGPLKVVGQIYHHRCSNCRKDVQFHLSKAEIMPTGRTAGFRCECGAGHFINLNHHILMDKKGETCNHTEPIRALEAALLALGHPLNSSHRIRTYADIGVTVQEQEALDAAVRNAQLVAETTKANAIIVIKDKAATDPAFAALVAVLDIK